MIEPAWTAMSDPADGAGSVIVLPPNRGRDPECLTRQVGWRLLQPLTTDAATELRIAIGQNASVLNGAVTVTRGTISSRPAASAVPNDSMYYGTDTGGCTTCRTAVCGLRSRLMLASIVTSANHTAVPFESVPRDRRGGWSFRDLADAAGSGAG